MTNSLGIDVGTTNAKVAVIADDGSLLASASRPIPTCREGDAVTQDPEVVWRAVTNAVSEVTAK